MAPGDLALGRMQGFVKSALVFAVLTLTPVWSSQSGELSCSSGQTCIVSTFGRLRCFGDGQQEMPPAEFAEDVSFVSVGPGYACAVKANNTLGCWGDNTYGQIDVPLGWRTDVVSVSTGLYAACAIKVNGTLGCWGKAAAVDPLFSDDVRQVSVGWASDRTCAVRNNTFARNELGCFGGGGGSSIPESWWDNVAGVSLGRGVTCIVKTDGTMGCFADGSTQGGSSSRAGAEVTPHADVPFSLTTDVEDVVAGGSVTCVLRSGGRLRCFGEPPPPGQVLCTVRADGRLWCSTNNSMSNALQVPPDLQQGVQGMCVGDTHVCASVAGGDVSCWGSDFFGESSIPDDWDEGPALAPAGPPAPEPSAAGTATNANHDANTADVESAMAPAPAAADVGLVLAPAAASTTGTTVEEVQDVESAPAPAAADAAAQEEVQLTLVGSGLLPWQDNYTVAVEETAMQVVTADGNGDSSGISISVAEVAVQPGSRRRRQLRGTAQQRSLLQEKEEGEWQQADGEAPSNDGGNSGGGGIVADDGDEEEDDDVVVLTLVVAAPDQRSAQQAADLLVEGLMGGGFAPQLEEQGVPVATAYVGTAFEPPPPSTVETSSQSSLQSLAQQQEPQEQQSDDGDSGINLSTGAIIGIAVGCSAALLLVAATIVGGALACRNRRRRRQTPKSSPPHGSDLQRKSGLGGNRGGSSSSLPSLGAKLTASCKAGNQEDETHQGDLIAARHATDAAGGSAREAAGGGGGEVGEPLRVHLVAGRVDPQQQYQRWGAGADADAREDAATAVEEDDIGDARVTVMAPPADEYGGVEGGGGGGSRGKWPGGRPPPPSGGRLPPGWLTLPQHTEHVDDNNDEDDDDVDTPGLHAQRSLHRMSSCLMPPPAIGGHLMHAGGHKTAGEGQHNSAAQRVADPSPTPSSGSSHNMATSGVSSGEAGHYPGGGGGQGGSGGGSPVSLKSLLATPLRAVVTGSGGGGNGSGHDGGRGNGGGDLPSSPVQVIKALCRSLTKSGDKAGGVAEFRSSITRMGNPLFDTDDVTKRQAHHRNHRGRGGSPVGVAGSGSSGGLLNPHYRTTRLSQSGSVGGSWGHVTASGNARGSGGRDAAAGLRDSRESVLSAADQTSMGGSGGSSSPGYLHSHGGARPEDDASPATFYMPFSDDFEFGTANSSPDLLAGLPTGGSSSIGGGMSI